MKQAINRIKEKHILIFFIFLMLLFYLKYIKYLSFPTILSDEFGYLANAAFLSGKNWSGVTRISPYYSYGYSMVLVPLFFLIKNTSHLYKAIILLNIFFYSIGYYISFLTIKDLFKKIDSRIIAVVCGIVSLYGANLYNVNASWAEALLYLVFWLLIYNLNQISKKVCIKNMMFFVFLLCYIYTIHQRTIGIVLVGCLCIFFLYINKSIDKKHLFMMLAMIIVFMVISILIKGIIQDNLWSNAVSTRLENANDYSGQITKIIAIIQSPKLIWNLIRGIIGKYYYLVISTGSIVTFGIIKIIKEIKITFIEKKQIHVVYLFMLLSLLVMMTTSSIFFINAVRFDTVLYGRYSEFAMSPLFICGIIAFIKRNFSLKDVIINIVILLVAYFSTKGFLSGTKNYIFPCTVNASLFYDRDLQAFAYNKYILFGVVFCLCIYLLMTRKQLIIKMIAFVLLIGFWNINVSKCMYDEKIPSHENIAHVGEIANHIEKNYDIYYLYDENNSDDEFPRSFIEVIQYMLSDTTISLINEQQLNKLNLKKNIYVITYGYELDASKYSSITSDIGYHLYISK